MPFALVRKLLIHRLKSGQVDAHAFTAALSELQSISSYDNDRAKELAAALEPFGYLPTPPKGPPCTRQDLKALFPRAFTKVKRPQGRSRRV